MDIVLIIKWLGYVVSAAFLFFGFLLFYHNTGEVISSATAAILSAALTLVSFIMLRWLVQVFLK